MRPQRICKQSSLSAISSPVYRTRNLGRNHLLLLCVSLALLLSTTVSARADDQIRAVRLSNVVGSVQILTGSETQFSQAYPNMPLMQGSTLKTGEDGRAEIQLEDGSVVRLTPNSSAAMSVLSRDSSGNTNSAVDLLTGLAYVEMKGTAKQRFVVHFAGIDEVVSSAPVKFRVKLDSNPAELAVLAGTAHLSAGAASSSIDVRANETVRFDPGSSSPFLLAQTVDPDSWDQWNADRDRAMGAIAAQQTREAIGSGNANPALSELDFYGNWYSGANGGSFWVPDGAGAGWDPYGSGYWGNYGGAGGYVWISGYPWGWLPYHCGNWNYFNSLNSWGWQPGGCLNNGLWYPTGGFGNVPSRYHRLPRPSLAPLHSLQNTGRAAGHNLIAVDRGPEATTLTPHPGGAPKMLGGGGESAHLLAKTGSPAASTFVRNTSPVTGHLEPGAFPVERSMSGLPAYRPIAPSVPSRATQSSFASRAGTGPISAPHMSAPMGASMPSSVAHSAPSGGASAGGGGHVK